ncbi:MAG: acyltransferase [Lachnospirales bacterium]
MIKELIRSIVYGNKATSERYIHYLKSLGCMIGERCTIFSPTKTTIDITRPWLIEIGNDVQITEGVTILTHGYDWSVLKGVYGEVLGSSGGVKIGNNVFIGMKSTILKGVNIGNNVIIGANSLINKDVPDNCVVAGNPAKVIMTIDAYYQKRKEKQYEEAAELVKLYRERYGKNPDEKALHEFFWLFTNGDDILPECWEHMQSLVGNRKQTDKVFVKNEKMFNNMKEFLNSVK